MPRVNPGITHTNAGRNDVERYIEGDITASERLAWESNFEAKPEALTTEEKDAFLAELSGVSLSSDAFFPFRDSIDHASKARRTGPLVVSVACRFKHSVCLVFFVVIVLLSVVSQHAPPSQSYPCPAPLPRA